MTGANNISMSDLANKYGKAKAIKEAESKPMKSRMSAARSAENLKMQPPETPDQYYGEMFKELEREGAA
ncbi:MAG: hypothetical protein ABNH21_06690 [Glaciecola sp.]|jgi:hypothetical protein